ncbi:MAG: hypothetical protein ACR2RB_11925 [Gammaproteobacteria bacterium]
MKSRSGEPVVAKKPVVKDDLDGADDFAEVQIENDMMDEIPLDEGAPVAEEASGEPRPASSVLSDYLEERRLQEYLKEVFDD